MLDVLLIEYINNPENDYANYNLALEYERIGQTAAAISFFLRTSERTEDKNLAYDCLIKIGQCFDKQGDRNYTVRSMFQSAIALIPERPEGYYFLSRRYEHDRNYFESYVYCQIALDVSNTDNKNSLGYPGKWALIFQKAVAAWWCGKGMESRKLLQVLVNEYWNQIDEAHRVAIKNNITNLGSGPVSHAFRQYDKSKYDKLRFKFKDSEKIERNFAQVYQDMFVLSMLNGKRNGTFLEIGGADPWHGNNTYLLEKAYDWNGVSVEFKEEFVKDYKQARPKVNLLNTDALTIDYRKLLQENFSGNVVDYLQLDIEPSENTYKCMLKIPFDDYKFRVITYEHDHYVDVSRIYREKSREFLRSKGYLLVANDISPDGVCTFEDWWVHPELIDEEILEVMTSITDDAKQIEDYMLTIEKTIEKPKEVNTFSVNRNMDYTSWIVDNFYSDPDKVRKFALSQEYVEGGFGRGFIGRRTDKQFLFDGLKKSFEDVMGRKITKWQEHGMNGRFQVAWSGEPLVYHCDSQKWGGMIYLTPGAPYQCGTTLYAHKQTRARTYYDQGWDAAWKDIPGDPHLDGTPFEPVDVLGNVYNRLVIFDASSIHSASQYFGTIIENARLWQMFFFDSE